MNGFGSNISIHNNTFHDICWVINTGGGAGASGFNIYNNNFYNYDHGVAGIGGDMANPANVNIYNNHFGSTANWDTTANRYHHDGIHIFFGSGTLSGVNIYNNLFDGNWGNNNTGHIFLEGNWNHVPNSLSNFSIYNNVFIQYPGDYLNDGFVSAAGPNFSFYNNTFLGSGVTNSTCASIGGANTIFKNNIVSGCTTLVSSGAGTTFSAGGLNNNLYANITPGGNPAWVYAGNADYTITLSKWKSTTGQDANSSYIATASFNSDGTLQSGSPAISAGVNLTSLGISTLNIDKAGTTRPAVVSWDIGAYQYSSGGSPPSDTTPPAPPTGVSVN